MSQAVLSPNLTKNSNGKCPKLPIRSAHALCYIGGLSVNLNHLKSIHIFWLDFSTELLLLDTHKVSEL